VKYSEDEALHNLQYARAAYCTKKLVNAWDCGEPCTKAPVAEGDSVRFIEDRGWQVQGYVAKLPSENATEDRCMISFRGIAEHWNYLLAIRIWMSPWPNWKDAETDKPKCLLANANCSALICPECRVYTGNAVAYQHLRKQMWKEVESLECKILLFSGHSMGGAISTMASFEARALGYQVPSVYTFGKPAMGNAVFRKKYIDLAAAQGVVPPMWRLVHYHDSVPTKGLCLGDKCEQEPQEIYYTTRDSSSFKECSDMEASDPSCSVSVSPNEAKEDPPGPGPGPNTGDDHEWYISTSVGSNEYIAECNAREGA